MKITFIILALLSLSNSIKAEEKKFQLTVSYAGSEDYGTIKTKKDDFEGEGEGEFVFGAGYFLTSRSRLEYHYTIFNHGAYDQGRKLRAHSFGLRQFLGKSFNFMPAIFYAHTSYVAGSATPVVDENLGLSFHLGNEWQWDNFCFGADWIKANYTIIDSNQFEATFLNLRFGISF